ncbi:MAG: alcohol dehydrogenase catalytic domain-containing protein [Methanobacteriaceae archaeon]|nr:alcohol dehydrogenase catalytic domain-containing protein [Methanobacteriaceae archaeon]
MKGIYFNKTPTYKEDLKKPIPNENQSLIKVLISAVCNTDKEIIKGYKDFKGIMGHEFVGIVEDSPNKELIGKYVVGEINENCKKCLYCKTNRPTHCINRKVLGLQDKDGCFSEYITLNTDLLHILPDTLSPYKAIYTEPFAAAFEILTQVDLDKIKEESTNIAILGDGRLAYCIAQAFHSINKEVTVIGKHDNKLKLFKNIPTVTTTKDKENDSFEIVIEATGSPLGINQAINIVRKKGTIVLKSTYAEDTTLPMTQVVVEEITIIGSRCGPFKPALEALAREDIIFPEITLYNLKDYEKAFNSKDFKSGFLINEF